VGVVAAVAGELGVGLVRHRADPHARATREWLERLVQPIPFSCGSGAPGYFRVYESPADRVKGAVGMDERTGLGGFASRFPEALARHRHRGRERSEMVPA
jgi:hypothetical protein